ncbi:MAG: imidazole glycerol phosphate synthase subunit HisH [Bacteroidia bacterium]
MIIAIINYNSGNIRSVAFTMERIGVEYLITDNPEQIRNADKVIFPGVGEAGSAMRYLKERKLDKLIASLKQPVLGICLGMQLMCRHSEEGDTGSLGIFDLSVKQFRKDLSLKVPQIGWNTVTDLDSPLFKGIAENEYMYFVHGYYVEEGPGKIASATYGLKYAAALNKDNFYAVQFHPEKSGKAGERLLKNFISLK